MPDQPDYVDINIQFDNGSKVPVEYTAPFTLKMTRGFDSHYMSVIVSDISKFPDPKAFRDGAKCKFIFDTPGASGGRVTGEWAMYLIRVEPSRTDPGMYIATFGDERWKIQYERFSMDFNIQWPDGSYREDSIAGGRPWQARDALVEAFKRMGRKIDISGLSVITLADALPNNLGNSPGGGFVQASMIEIAGPILAALEADLVVKPDGEFAAVEKSGDPGDKKPLEKLRQMTRIVDTVALGKNGWEKPRKLRLAFEIMSEACLESTVSQTGSGAEIMSEPDNVMPRLTLELVDGEEWWDAQAEDIADTEWKRIPQELEDMGYTTASSADTMVGENYFLPNIIPFKRNVPWGPIVESGDPTANVNAVLKKEWADGQLRQHWHKTYRINFPATGKDLSKDARILAWMQFGRLTPGGQTRSKGAVFADWCEELVHAVRLRQDDPLNATFSSNHPWDPERPAPLTAKWIDQVGNELIFRMEPTENQRLAQAKIYPGQFSRPIKHNNWFDTVAEVPIANSALQHAFRARFDFRVFFAGRIIAEDGRLIKAGANHGDGEMEGRRYVVTRKLFDDGSIEFVDLRSEVVTANFGYTTADMRTPLGSLSRIFPSNLLNKRDVTETVDRVVANLKKDYAMGLSGGIAVAGVQPLADKILTGGDVHEMSVTVGDPDPWSIKTQYFIIPGIHSWSIDKESKDGRIPQLITNG